MSDPITVDLPGGPCSWVIDPATTGCECTGWDDYTDQQRETAAILAAKFLWAATARRFGQCEITIETCQDQQGQPTWRGYPATGGNAWVPYLLDGVWFNAPGGGQWCCDRVCTITLPPPVASTDAVLSVITGTGELETDTYRLYDGTRLARIDGHCWPSCCIGGAGGPVTVTYLQGFPVPPDVAIAANVLACEYAAACTGGECRLPRRVASMVQHGTNVDFTDLPGPGNPVMATGIPIIDDVIKAHNPFGLVARPRLINPNAMMPRRPM